MTAADLQDEPPWIQSELRSADVEVLNLPPIYSYSRDIGSINFPRPRTMEEAGVKRVWFGGEMIYPLPDKQADSVKSET